MRYTASQHAVIAREVCRALRGRRSQRQLSRRLGHRSNVAYAWESGRRAPTLATVLGLAARDGVDVRARLADFTRAPAALPRELAPDDGALAAALLRAVKGTLGHAELGRRLGLSASQVSRLASGACELRLPEALAWVDATTDRLVDFVAVLTDPRALPSLARDARALEERRRIATELPWSHAVLRVLELASYRSLPTHDDAWVAARLGLDEADVREALAALARAGLVRRRRGRFSTTAETVDMTAGPPGPRRALKGHWLEVSRQRLLAGAPGLYSYNLVSVSREDLALLRDLHMRYFHEVRQIVAESSAPECVALVGLQLFELGNEAHEGVAAPPPLQVG